ncbi:hypothetical protein RHGRI_015611 [Rhododendron griersonianum]|uniref:Uncharacterized protein n=1 Tax=Rhododendron griersonianum TaxID=479676 RepID=A0AAV6KDV9_9ERIC|nr:hypothetical protein RHGRI_015611 [Rhododendron griersonianum]
MSQSSYLPSVHPVAIISRQFCAPYPVDITIASKLLTINKGNFTATDVNGNVMFRIKGRFFTLHGRHILLDAAGNPMLTLQHKMHRNNIIHLPVIGRDSFSVTVYPNVDYAFIVALVVVLEEIHDEGRHHHLRP